MRRTLRVLLSTDALNARVRETLVASLYTHPSSMAIGAMCGIATSLAAAVLSGSDELFVAATVLAGIAAFRVATAFHLQSRTQEHDTRFLETLYEAGAWSYALILGLFAARCLHLGVHSSIQMMMVCNAVGYGVGISARNAGRPLIAIGQLTLAIAPVIVALVLKGRAANLVLAGSMVLLLPAMVSIILTTFRMVRDSVRSAEKSARLAGRMQTLARTDTVTGLNNRTGLEHHLKQRVKNDGQNLALFWLDLDRFKEVNDTLGHPIGDLVLMEVATRLRECSPEGAMVARFGGDEFIVVCDGCDQEELVTMAGDLLDAINRPVRIDGERLQIGASMGIARLPQDGTDMEAVMKGADLALYRSKVNGRNQFNFFDPTMTRDLIRRREIEHELRVAISKDELSIHFQPIVDLATGEVRSFEALVRWFHPHKGELPPAEFIPVAEETGLIITLGNWIAAQAARAAAHWPDEVTLCVNLSPVQIRAPGAALGILRAIRDAGLPPGRLELEVTESVFLDSGHSTAEFMAQMTAAGVRFALDDFGTGYSSLGYLHQYPFSKIKVDRSFVSGAHVGKKSSAIIRAVAEMGAQLEMEIVAEGLETVEQVRTVQAAGCTLGQGFYFSRAVPNHLAMQMLAGRDEGKVRRIAR